MNMENWLQLVSIEPFFVENSIKSLAYSIWAVMHWHSKQNKET